uniref:Cytochrome c oxidase subunit n=1 Tax=Helicotheca tamesis TaxID=374047 RepID=A0A7S2MJB1_9STRA|mmetsp:Transcript_16893/g.23167  ORF Transcript_16893/g.23167 Transcript_16893/m.23167 type:complete len:146 (+) Transcript_16893:77-514(+)
MSLVAARYAATRAVRARAATAGQRRSAQTVPRLGTEEEMKAEAVAQLRARIARQKEIEAKTHTPMAEELDEMWKWIKISLFVAAPVCAITMIKDVLTMEHEHRKPGPEPEYMQIRTKPFPWECEDCALFDLDCWKKCRAEKAAES